MHDHTAIFNRPVCRNGSFGLQQRDRGARGQRFVKRRQISGAENIQLGRGLARQTTADNGPLRGGGSC